MRTGLLFTSGVVEQHLLWIVLYVGPDLMLPLTSALAAVAGVVLMFWHRVTGVLRAGWQMLLDRAKPPRE
jgi:hypothetical protein